MRLRAEPSLRKSSPPSVKQPPEQELWCELCDQPASAWDWSAEAQQLICPACIERMLEDQIP